MMRRRKDSGFTLIELMIVIAVIGILAIVLIPRIGTVKNQAKESGLDTNVRLVQGYVESKISKWAANEVVQADIVDEIVAAFKFTDATKQLVNPIAGKPENAIEVADATAVGALATHNPVIVITAVDNDTTPLLSPSTALAGAEGAVVVTVTAGDVDEEITKINIFAYGNGGKMLTDKTVEITP